MYKNSDIKTFFLKRRKAVNISNEFAILKKCYGKETEMRYSFPLVWWVFLASLITGIS